eukprot:CAMPEP_0195027176 /NCGR_PEP_ID=MMETSP0326_2-20130528/51819_1 /TAXON_ID=2866 ORGANISM="Crypthecodinium cohnii, Strain Seligo" /NCGR_SAMPLE_ID=MMETSP0326_2 /ASSEMBLY_ACC=CAM_ASM_000348 /LENGTH=114 /DNA_ID=CAMNT_0040049295 /DNA_START=200 /DNA_END=544 /DNA_ORIENTATION=+
MAQDQGVHVESQRPPLGPHSKQAPDGDGGGRPVQVDDGVGIGGPEQLPCFSKLLHPWELRDDVRVCEEHPMARADPFKALVQGGRTVQELVQFLQRVARWILPILGHLVTCAKM